MPESKLEPARSDAASRNVVLSAVIGACVAAIVLFAFVLPAEYGIDPTGLGRVLGLTEMNAVAEPTRTFQIVNVIGGNESVKEVEIPDFGEPVPLPNPEVYQHRDAAPRTDTVNVMIPAEGETEIKTVLGTSQMIVFSWHTDRGAIYSDFHGHDPEAGDEFWVRYSEHQEAAGDDGSLVAPFSGEHGWYWLNFNDFPVTVTLTLTGYYDDIIDYSELF
jgi:hypothetical protein